ncbi:MAG: stage II sporulation protein D [Oscillospiraceae bacterium]|nr:stage II sporulation protein D [Oscillospiraceae bacterium]
MKDTLKILGIFAILTMMIPMLSFFSPKNEETVSESPAADITEEADIPAIDADGMFRVLDCTTGQVTEMTMTEYVVGAVLGEMPASFHDEAIKAQAVAAHTYAVRRMLQQQDSPDPQLKGAYISNDSTKYQAYFSPEQAAYFYGDAYEAHNSRITALAEEVINELIVFNGEPIIAAFHSSSGAMTESAENIWGSEIPYLVPVENSENAVPADTIFTAAELEARFSQKYGTVFPEDLSEWFRINSVSPSGTVLSFSAGDTILTGTEVRTLLNLRSACFTAELSDDGGSFIFSVKGSGHGVGLSQHGANAMAENGADYKQILAHYYKGAEIISFGS